MTKVKIEKEQILILLRKIKPPQINFPFNNFQKKGNF